MAKTNPVLNAEIRTVTGKKVKNLRKQGILPATIYGQGMEPISLQVNNKEMEVIFKHTGESGLVDLVMDGKTYPILFRNPQYHPMWSNLVHIDCYKVNLKEKITTNVPLEFIGEAQAVKDGNVMVQVIDEIEVEALPTDLPEKVEVDLTKLETLESQITIADLVVDRSKVEIKNDAEQVVVKVEEPKVEEEPVVEEAEVAPGEVPATEQKSPDEKAADEAKEAEEKKKDKE
jgi:large subunit ribosomal protein L25